MDIFLPIVIVAIFFIIFTVCGWCFKRKRDGTIFQTNTPVTHHIPTATPQVVPPYPIDARHPTPQNVMPPAPGFAPSSGYHTTPYPPASNMPYPSNSPYPPQGSAPGYPPAPYPPTSGSTYTSPPSYSEAVGHGIMPPQAPTNEIYAKQAPYNPNY